MLKFGQWKNLLVREMDGDFDKALFKGAANVGASRATQGVENLSSVSKKATALMQLISRSLEGAKPSEKKSILAIVKRQLGIMAGEPAPVNPQSMGSDLEQ
jgi:hypothetical protein